MKRFGFLSLGKVLIATIAICAVAPSAKADLGLEFVSNGSTTNLTVVPGATGTGVVVGDFTVNYTVTETFKNGVETLSLDVTAVKGSGSTSANASALSYYLTDTSISTPTVGGTLQSTLSTTYSGSNGNFASSNLATYTDGGNGTITTSSSTSIPGINTPYLLETSGQIRHAANGSTATVTSTAAVIGVPEPTGVIAALAGLPCMGLVVGFARRRRAVEPAAM